MMWCSSPPGSPDPLPLPRRFVVIEYVMLRGVNDTAEDAARLAQVGGSGGAVPRRFGSRDPLGGEQGLAQWSGKLAVVRKTRPCNFLCP